MKIAIVGAGFEVPEASTFDELAKIIYSGKDVSISGTKNDNSDGNFIPIGYQMNNNSMFAAKEFGYSSEEAKLMDPQQRRLLTVIWKMLSEYDMTDGLNDSNTAVYTTLGNSNYFLKNISNNLNDITYSTFINNTPDTAAARISYLFNLKGYALNIGSSCSSAGMAINMAVDALTAKKIDAAIIGGSNLNVSNTIGYKYIDGGIFSKSGKCSPFDNDSDGMVPGVGTIAITLKRLDEAIQNKDTILAIIDSVGSSNDGSQKASFTAPSIDGEKQAINSAYQQIDIPNYKVDYIETHGTGTSIGDAIEIQSIIECFGSKTSPVIIGSSKANFGHLDHVSALLSILKSIVLFKYQMIPKEANFTLLNSILTTSSKKIKINTKNEKTNLDIIGINSFGIGGNNCHIILERPRNDLYNNMRYPIPSKKLDELSYWINEKKKINDSIVSTDVATTDISDFLVDFLGNIDNTELYKETIYSLDLDSFILLELLEKFNKEYKTNLNYSQFQNGSDNFLDIFKNAIKYDEKIISNDNNFIHKLNSIDPQKKTLFFIHPAGGSVTGYRNFFEHTKNYNVFTISFPFDYIDYIKYYGLHELAMLYTEKIRKIMPDNDNFLLGGYSFGGNLAFEIERCFEESTTVSHDLIMVDSHPIEAYTTNLTKVDDDVYSYAKKEFFKQGIFNDNVSDETINKYGNVWKLNHKMLKEYNLPKSSQLSCTLYILICKETENLLLLKKLGILYLNKSSWQKYFRKEINFSYIDGNHYSIYSNRKLGNNIGNIINSIMSEDVIRDTIV